MDWRKALISVGILFAIGMHFVPYLYRGRIQPNILWPFLSWTMYKHSRPAGPIQARTRRFIGLTRSGQTEEVTARLVGLGPPAMIKLYIRPMMAGDSSAVRKLLDRINIGRSDSFVAVRVEDETYTVTDTGLLREKSPVLTYSVESSQNR